MGSGQVHHLDGPSGAERACDQVRVAIQRGDLRPGQAVSLRTLAERHRVRVPTLALLLGRLESEGLLTVRDDMAFVAPLDYKALLEAQQMTLTMMQALLPPAVEQLGPMCLNRLHQRIPSIGSDAQLLTDDAHTDFVLTASSFMAALTDEMAPAQARSILRDLITYSARYDVMAGYLLGAVRDVSAKDFIGTQRELIDLLRSGKVDLAVKLELGMLGRIRAFEVIGLDCPRVSADDQEIAEVIPLRRRSRRGD